MGTSEAQLRREAEQDRDRMSDTLEAIGDRLSPERVVERRKAAIGQGFKRVRESVMGSPSYVEPSTQRMRQGAHDMKDAARGAAEKVQHAPEALADQTRGNPIAAGIVAFGVGMLVATAFPKTRTEQQLLETARPSLDRAKEELRDTGREFGSDVKQHAQEAADQVKSAGAEAAQNVKEEARTSAQRVSDEVRNS
jgi:hypothetical protein